MGNDREAVKPWWIFFPLKGFTLTNKRHDLRKPIFGDVTIVARDHMENIVSLLNLNKMISKQHNHESDVLYMLQNATLGEDFQSFISVKRSGRVKTRELRSSMVVAAESRAYEIAALLTLAFLYQNKLGGTCGLVEQLHRRRKSIAMLELEGGGFAFQSGGEFGQMILNERYNIRMSRAELKKLLYQRKFSGLTNVLLRQRQNLGKSLRNAVTQSALMLADSVHAVNPSSQLLGSVTAIELLLADLGDSYEKIKGRLSALVGRDLVDRYDAEMVFQTRHHFVHKGERLKARIVALRAIALALLGLLNYADTAPAFSTKSDFLHYLDFISSADRLSKKWNSDEKIAFSFLVKHKRQKHKFAFV